MLYCADATDGVLAPEADILLCTRNNDMVELGLAIFLVLDNKPSTKTLRNLDIIPPPYQILRIEQL